jgi:hypothetical protein
LRDPVPSAHHEPVSWEPFDAEPGSAILDALIEINAKLADIRDDVSEIRASLGEDDGEEEEEDD